MFHHCLCYVPAAAVVDWEVFGWLDWITQMIVCLAFWHHQWVMKAFSSYSFTHPALCCVTAVLNLFQTFNRSIFKCLIALNATVLGQKDTNLWSWIINRSKQKSGRKVSGEKFFFSLLLQMVNPAAHFSHSESTLIRREAAETLMKRRAGDRSAGAGLTAVIRERNGWHGLSG